MNTVKRNEIRATIGLKIDIDSEIEMGLEVDDVEQYVITQMVEFLYSAMINNELEQYISVERVRK
jgi:hypothetical protein